MKRTFLCNILLTSALIAICMASFTGCFHENIRKDTSHISETELKQLEGNAEDVVKAYFREKYDVQAAVTHQAIAGGVFLGPDSSAEQYYNLTVSITDGEYYTELYVKNESYYGKLMKDKMIQWIDPYILQAGLDDYIIEYSCTEVCFPSEYATDLTADTFISLTSKNRKLSACFNLLISKSEYMQHENLSEEFNDLKSHLKQIDGEITLHLYVYEDKDYTQIKNGNTSHFNSILSSKILSYTE